jgi:hypothetical protein
MTATEQKVGFELKPQGFSSAKGTTLLTTENPQPQQITLGATTLKPFGVYIVAVEK